jgi:hypothetical protein
MNINELLKEIQRCFVSLELTDEMPKDVCPADMVHLIDEYLRGMS